MAHRCWALAQIRADDSEPFPQSHLASTRPCSEGRTRYTLLHWAHPVVARYHFRPVSLCGGFSAGRSASNAAPASKCKNGLLACQASWVKPARVSRQPIMESIGSEDQILQAIPRSGRLGRLAAHKSILVCETARGPTCTPTAKKTCQADFAARPGNPGCIGSVACGCQKTQSDSSSITGLRGKWGFGKADEPDKAQGHNNNVLIQASKIPRRRLDCETPRPLSRCRRWRQTLRVRCAQNVFNGVIENWKDEQSNVGYGECGPIV